MSGQRRSCCDVPDELAPETARRPGAAEFATADRTDGQIAAPGDRRRPGLIRVARRPFVIADRTEKT